LWDVLRHRKGGDHTLAALRSIRAVRPDGAPIYVIMDNLSANTTPAVHAWAEKSKVQLCLTPTYYSWANPIEAQFGPLRTFMANSNYPNHTVRLVISRHICAGATPNGRHPDLAAQRRERARIRSERGHRCGRPRTA
jgi:DDE superfamily endonuclease